LIEKVRDQLVSAGLERHGKLGRGIRRLGVNRGVETGHAQMRLGNSARSAAGIGRRRKRLGHDLAELLGPAPQLELVNPVAVDDQIPRSGRYALIETAPVVALAAQPVVGVARTASRAWGAFMGLAFGFGCGSEIPNATPMAGPRDRGPRAVRESSGANPSHRPGPCHPTGAGVRGGRRVRADDNQGRRRRARDLRAWRRRGW
jgi:hypothetical protein